VRAVFLKLFSSLFPKSSSEQILQKKRSERERESLYSICGYPCGRVREKNSAAARVQNKETRFISSFSSLSVSLSVSLMVTRAGCEKQQIYIIIL
jgi:hypothetical protein